MSDQQKRREAVAAWHRGECERAIQLLKAAA